MIRFLIILLCLGTGEIVRAVSQDIDQWEKLYQEPVTVRYHAEDVKNSTQVMTMIHEELYRITGDLRLPEVHSFIVVITSTEEEFHALTGGEIPDWGIGAANPMQRILFLKSPRFSSTETDHRKVVIHELSHVLLGMVLDGKLSPRWFDEGFALYEAGELGLGRTTNLARSLFSGEFLNLAQIEDVLIFQKEKAALAYQESRSAIDHLITSYGMEAFTDIAWFLRDGKTMEDGFYEAIGISLEEFQDEWMQKLRRRYALYPFLQFPYILSAAFLCLFLTAYLVTRYRSRKKKKMWEKEEEMYELKILEEDSTSH